jgi:hypothetical protein
MAKAQHAQRYRQLPGLLRGLREEAGLTQRALAARLRTTHVRGAQNLYCEIEYGRVCEPVCDEQ